MTNISDCYRKTPFNLLVEVNSEHRKVLNGAVTYLVKKKKVTVVSILGHWEALRCF